MPINTAGEKQLAEIQQVIQQKLDEVESLPFGMLTGRRLQIANHGSAQVREMISLQLASIGARVGADFLRETPAVALEQFAIVAMARDEDAAGLLKSLINSFIVAYTAPETAGHAVAHLEGIEALRKEVAEQRKSAQINHAQVLQ